MADSPATALRMLRRIGPVAAGRFAVSRLLGIRRFKIWLRRLAPDATDHEVVDVLIHRRLGEGQPVFAMQRPAEILALLERVRAIQPRNVLEIGTAAGGTLLLLARASSPEATIVSVDLPGGPFGGGYGSWRQPLYRSFAGRAQTLVLLRGNSHQPAMSRRIRELLRNEPLDFVFIDGDHTFEGARRDFLDYGTLVRSGGLIAFHDICPDPAQPDLQVPRLWNELRLLHPSQELVEDPGQAGFGIGVLRVAEQRVPA